ncbi:Uu.00g022840.m01.CDS01 [Anthostomella pinea]|uniref:Uu.00g022840.m01.CDS01 n=1 Tax=Anthostomella pinea TaxID=933095 RepID=A0AAI8YR09_9PEZI|nr:Uu.00g022840.m01.CDS01 [Anthostomella pinea]
MNPVNTKPYNLPDDAVWLITGCSSGIGRALATIVASKPSHRLIATARNNASLTYLPSDNPKILKLPLDVTSPKSVDDAFSAAAVHFGAAFRLDVVVNNAGYELQGDTESATEEQAHDQMETVFFGSARVTMKAVKVMRESTAGLGGLVMNLSSLAGQCTFAGQSYYHAAKFAVEGFTESVAREMHPDWNINFCIIEPGGVKTNFEKSSKKFIAPHPAYKAPDMPSRRIEAFVKKGQEAGAGLEPEAVAKTIYDLASRGQQIPLRVPLSLIAWGLIKSKCEGTLKDLEGLKEISAMGQTTAPDTRKI